MKQIRKLNLSVSSINLAVGLWAVKFYIIYYYLFIMCYVSLAVNVIGVALRCTASSKKTTYIEMYPSLTSYLL